MRRARYALIVWAVLWVSIYPLDLLGVHGMITGLLIACWFIVYWVLCFYYGRAKGFSIEIWIACAIFIPMGLFVLAILKPKRL